jgi:hypothetical protein
MNKTPCSKKNTTRLSKTIAKSAKMIRDALKNTETPEGLSYFDYFKDLDWANECVFSYPGESWIGIYLKDSDGNPYWTRDSSGKITSQRLYFQLGVDADGDPEIINYTNKVPAELVSKLSCEVVDGKCVSSEPKISVPKKNVVVPKAPKVISSNNVASTSGTSSSSSSTSSQNIQKNQDSQKKITREEFEKMGSKEVIINWMIENMNPVDILACLQKDPDSLNSEITEITAGMNNLEVEEVFKDISFEDIVSQVNNIANLETKYARIIEICSTSNVKDEDSFEIRKSKKKGVELVLDDSVLSISDIESLLEDCAKKEAVRLTKQLKKR